MKNTLWILILFIIIGCSSTKEFPVITKDKAVPRTSAILVARISFEDEFNDPEAMEMKTFQSEDLLKNKEGIAERRKRIKSTELWEPLHYLAKFQFILQKKGGEEVYAFTRFNRDLLQYEAVALHQIDPGEYQWNQFNMIERRFHDPGPGEEIRRWEPHPVTYPYHFANWNFEPGKVYYIGDIKFFFKTKKFSFGLYPRENVVENVTMTHMTVRNRFEEAKTELKEKKPWFPADAMVDLSQDLDLLNKEGKLVEGKLEEKKEKEKPERDKEKYFF